MTNRLHKEVESLKKHLLSLVAEVEENVRMSVEALEKLNSTLAEKVIAADLNVDRREVDIEEECLKILALYQPVANDLRFIIAVLKINTDLERISDLAVNIAERAAFLVTAKRIQMPFDFTLMSDQVQDMLRKSINALITLNAQDAYEICADDDIVDAYHREMYVIVQDAIRKNPDDLDELIHYLGVSRHLERIADQTTNIAENIIYLINGDIVRHHVEDFKKSDCQQP
ncbi:phosphate signaling complex protein PhoU [bacterium]|nr:phosphate signaling complex protein PhoU [bacterium]